MLIDNDYDTTLEKILKRGKRQPNRTGIDTIALFGINMHFNLKEEGFPLVDRRKINYKPIVAELLWLLSGSTNNKDLVERGCNYWTPWVSKEFEEKHGFEEGSFGPTYSFNIRHFGGNYPRKNDAQIAKNMGLQDYYGMGGFDQLSYVVTELKTNKTSRRILFSLWNPKELHRMRLPPCAYSAQFLVGPNDELTTIVTLRSADYPVGVPANIASYATLTHLLALECGLEPYELVVETHDSHIYANQIDKVHEYLDRPHPCSKPSLQITSKDNLSLYETDDFTLEGYSSCGPLSFPVAV